MKKLLTVATALFLSGGLVLNAQLPTPKKKAAPKQVVNNENVPVKQNSGAQNSKRTAAGPEWFTPSEAVRSFNGGATSGYSYTTLFPDTNALFTYSGTGGDVTFDNNINSLGMVFDPRSTIYDGVPFKTDRWSNYTVDSMRFTFFYRRFNADASIVDTLVVTTFDRTSVRRTWTNIYAGAVDYTRNRYTATGTNARTQVILLTKDDTSYLAQERILGVNQTVAGANTGANYFGATITFLPGYRGYDHGAPFDTVCNFVTGVVDSTRSNIVRVLGYYDPSMFQESTTIPTVASGNRIYNHGIVAEPTQRYLLTSGIDYYFPAFYQSVHLFPYIEFLVSSPNVSVNTISSATISSIYPNPTNGGDVVVEMNSEISTSAVVTITDVTGKVVKTIDVQLVNGSNDINVNVDGLSKGIYVISVKAEGVNTVSKLTIE